ncbi:MAG: hypothetical protein ACYS1A_13200 [Planctomycetota bacterium]|jgi:hypothetical protein
MKNAVVSTILGILLCVMLLVLVGCGPYDQLGETTAEGHRRHKRVFRINRQEMMTDIDKVFLFDQPSKLTERKIP